MNPNLYDVLTMCPPGEMWDYVRNIPNEPSKCNQWKHFHQMSSEHLKCSLPLPTGHIVGKMHMSSKCTQHVITGFQAPLPPVIAEADWWITPLPEAIYAFSFVVNSSSTLRRPRRKHTWVGEEFMTTRVVWMGGTQWRWIDQHNHCLVPPVSSVSFWS